MTFGDLLDHLRRDILRDISDDVVEGDDPRLWSNTTLMRYMNDAQRVFAKKALVLRERFEMTTVAGQREYPLDPRVFAVISAKFEGNSSYQGGFLALNPGIMPGTKLIPFDSADMGRTGHSQIEAWQTPDSRWFDINRLDRLPPGKPLAYDTDEVVAAGGEMVMRLYPTPDVDHGNCLIRFRATRLPKPFDLDQLEAECELPEDYQLQMLDYAASKALKIADPEMGDPQKAQELKDDFDRNVEIARREMLRKMFTPQAWGFGRNGFTYVGN